MSLGAQIILAGFLVFFACLAAHIVIWRLKTPWVSSFIILIVFLAVPGAAFLFPLCRGSALFGFGPLEWAEILLLHFSLSAAYISTYPAVRAVSPSLDILIMISSSKRRRMTEEEMRIHFTNKRLVTARIDDLTDYRFIYEEGGGFKLGSVAKLIVWVFNGYRKILGLPAGTG